MIILMTLYLLTEIQRAEFHSIALSRLYVHSHVAIYVYPNDSYKSINQTEFQEFANCRMALIYTLHYRYAIFISGKLFCKHTFFFTIDLHTFQYVLILIIFVCVNSHGRKIP